MDLCPVVSSPPGGRLAEMANVPPAPVQAVSARAGMRSRPQVFTMRWRGAAVRSWVRPGGGREIHTSLPRAPVVTCRFTPWRRCLPEWSERPSPTRSHSVRASSPRTYSASASRRRAWPGESARPPREACRNPISWAANGLLWPSPTSSGSGAWRTCRTQSSSPLSPRPGRPPSVPRSSGPGPRPSPCGSSSAWREESSPEPSWPPWSTSRPGPSSQTCVRARARPRGPTARYARSGHRSWRRHASRRLLLVLVLRLLGLL